MIRTRAPSWPVARRSTGGLLAVQSDINRSEEVVLSVNLALCDPVKLVPLLDVVELEMEDLPTIVS